MEENKGRLYKHFKKGSVYIFIGEGKMESDPSKRVAIYQSEESGIIWVRPYEEFFGYVDDEGMTRRRFSPYRRYNYDD